MMVKFKLLLSLLFLTTFSTIVQASPLMIANDIQQVTSPKGLKFYYRHENYVPVIHVNLAFNKAGYAYDPPRKNGVAKLMTLIAAEGSEADNPYVYYTKMSKFGGQISYSIDEDNFYVDVACLKSDLNPVLDLVAESLRAPRVRETEFNFALRKQKSQILKQREDTEFVARTLWEKAVFPDSPYSYTENGTLETLANVTDKDLKTYSRNIFNQGNFYASAVGEISASEFADSLDHFNGRLRTNANKTPEIAAAIPLQKEQRILVDRRSNTAYIFFGMKGIYFKDPDFFAADVLSFIVGGNNSSRLSKKLTSGYPLAYFIRTSHDHYQNAAMFRGILATINENTIVNLDLIANELTNLQTTGVTQEELNRARELSKQALTVNMDDDAYLARFLSILQRNGLTVEFLNNYDINVDKLTLAEVNRVAKRFFNPSNLTSVIVGDLSIINKISNSKE